MTVFTIGHSTRSLVRFLQLLENAGVAHVVDVRRFPVSRRHPHFSRDRLAASLAEASISYAHAPELGGHRVPVDESPNAGLRVAAFRGYADHMRTTEFRDAVDELLLTVRKQLSALLCAEADPSKCHRSLLADVLTVRGVRVRHIVDTATTEHHLSARARVSEGAVLYPARHLDSQGKLFGAG